MSTIVRTPESIASPPGTTRRGKRLLGAAAIALGALLGSTAHAQAFTEHFNDITQLTGNGWFLQNNSAPVGITNFTQGPGVAGGGPFDAQSGAANAFISANFNNTAGSSGVISSWLATPNRTFRNGDVLTFYTRAPTVNGTEYPDRLEVRLSTNGASTNVGAPGNNVGDFTTLLLSINPTLVTGVYPKVWTQFTVTLSGLPAPTSGRTAFRYFVTGAGPTGTNSDYIGIDNVVYTPYVCPAFTMTPGGALPGASYFTAYSTTLTQTGALGAPNYAVTAGALPSGLTLASGGTISGTPTATGTFNFTVTVNDASGCSGSQNYSITTAATLPPAPQGVSASAGDAEAVVSFSPPPHDGGSPIVDYTATCTDGAVSLFAIGPDSPLTVSGLTNGVEYTCDVYATNAVGPGFPSAPSNSVTPMGEQSITFDAQDDQIYSPAGSFAIDPLASASSGLDASRSISVLTTSRRQV